MLLLLAAGVVGSLALIAQHHYAAGWCSSPGCQLAVAVAVASACAAQYLVWRIILYPFFFSPLRTLPSPKQPPFYRRLVVEPAYEQLVRWINEIPNDGLIRYHGRLNAERVLVTTPQGCRDVLQTKAYDYIKLPWALEVMGQFGPQGILVAPPHKHKMDRKLLQPAFKFTYIKSLSPIFWDEGAKFLTAIEKDLRASANGSVDIGQRLHHVTLDIVTLTSFGASINAVQDPASARVKHFKNLFATNKDHFIYRATAYFMPSFLYRRLPVKARYEIAKARDAVTDFVRPMIHERRSTKKDPASGQYAQGDIIATLLQSGETFSDAYLIDQSINFIVAGQETTATAVALALYSLSQNPELQSRLRAEIREKLPSPSENTKVDSELVESLPYLTAVCNEVLRLFSPVVFCHRQTIVPSTTVGSVRIPQSTVVTVAPGVIHASRHVWGDRAGEFDPERWLSTKDGQLKVDPLGGRDEPWAVMPFAYGPRQCIGERFARSEMLSLVAQLVGRFEWKFKGIGRNGDKPMRIIYSVVAGPAGGGVTMYANRINGW